MRRALVVASLAAASIVAFAPAVASQTDRARAEDHFTDAEIERAERYRGPRYVLSIGGLALDLVVLGLLGLGRGARRLGAWAERAGRGRWWTTTLLLCVAVTLVPVLLSLPLGLLRHRHDRRFGLATNTIPEFLVDVAKASGFALLIAAIAGLAFVGIARVLRRRWPAAVVIAGAALTFGAVFVFPLVYEPAFNRFTPADAATHDRVVALARDAGVPVGDVLIVDASRRTTRRNAYVSGFWGTKRVVLYDTLVRGAQPREVDLVVAHELAHMAHGDVLKGTAYSVAGIVAFVAAVRLLVGSARIRAWSGVRAAGDARIVPFLAFVIAVGTILVMPIANGISRAQEAAADRAAIELTNDPDAAIRLEVDLARSNIADLRPNGFVRWMFFTHPSTIERIQIALDAKRDT